MIKFSKKKIAIIVFRLVLILVLIETGLHISSFIHLYYQDFRNKISLNEKDDYRILVLGDSYSLWNDGSSWPREMEAILNNKSQDIKFQVINKAIAGSPSQILSKTDDYLDVYDPNMVVTMIGLLDKEKPVIFNESQTEKTIPILHNLKLVKFLKSQKNSLKQSTPNKNEGKLNQSFINKEIERELEAAIERDPDNISNHIELFAKHLRMKEYKELNELFTKYLRMKEYEKIEEIIKTLKTSNPQHSKMFNAMLWDTYYIQKKYKAAEDISIRGVEEDQSYDLSYYQLGLLNKNEKRLEEAEEMFKKAIEINPNNFNAYFELGLLYLDLNRSKKSKEIFRRIAPVGSDKNAIDESYKKLDEAMDHYNRREIIKAGLSAKKAIAINPNNEWAYFALGAIYFSQATYSQEVEEMFWRVIKIKPRTENAFFKLGDYYKKFNRTEESIEMFEKVIELNPVKGEAYLRLGEIYSELGKRNNNFAMIRESIKMFKKMLEINPKDEKAMVMLAEQYQILNMTSESIKLFEKLIELYPKNESAEKAYLKLGEYYLSKNMSKEADDMFKKVEELNPNLLAVIYGKLRLHFQKEGMFEEAEEMFKREIALRKGYYNPTLQENYRKLYSRLEEREIKLVAMQYPTVSLTELKKLFIGDEDIIFVSNEENFREVLEMEGYDAIFTDQYGGAHGHLTKKGSEILAKNIAYSILKELEIDY